MLGRSSDLPEVAGPLRPRGGSRGVLHLEGPSGRRLSLVDSAEAMGPRCLLVEGGFEALGVGELEDFDLAEVAVVYEPAAPRGVPDDGFAPVWRDWLGFCEEECFSPVVGALVESGLGSAVGLGPGLTPLGDDVLSGYFLGLRVLGRDVDLDSLDLSKTHWLSRQMVLDAAEGLCWMPFKGLILALLSGDGASLAKWVERCLSFGSTSGKGYLLGMAMAFEGMGGASFCRG